MKPMTDAELEALFRKHVPRNGWQIDPSAGFVGSRFYDFARELEHYALAAGMMMTAKDSIRPAGGAGDSPPPPKGRGTLAAFFGWVLG
jgi:hypothetical protein